MSRTLVFALSTPYQFTVPHGIAQFVVKQLELLKPHYERVIVVTDNNEAATQLSHKCEIVKVSPKLGEWAKWQAGIAHLQLTKDTDYSITLLSDAAFGPTKSFSDYLAKMEQVETEVNAEQPPAAKYWIFSNTGKPFFFYFPADIASSAAFRAFWKATSPSVSDATTLRGHLTRAMATAGFSPEYLVPTDPKASTVGMANPRAPRPDLWVAQEAPFLSVNDLLERPDFAPYALDYLAAGGFPAAVASAHLSQLTAPDEKSLLWAKQQNYRFGAVVKTDDDASSQPETAVAIHVHAHFPEMLPAFFDAFATYQFPFTLFITTAEAKVAAVEELLEPYQFGAEVIAVPNLGRDIYPLHLLKDKLANYDVICHFHTKKTSHDRDFVGTTWLQDLMEMLVLPGNAIVADLAARPELGLVIADVPSFFRLNRSVKPEGEAPLIPMLNHLWEKMGIAREFDFAERSTFVMSYGTFFWARRQAIQPLLDLDLKAEIPPEPIPAHHTILHALERILVYLAWSQGYDFAISEGRYLTVFADEAAPHLEAVPFRSLLRQKVSNRIPTKVKQSVRGVLPGGNQ